MNIEYTGRNYNIDDRLRTFTEDKLEKLGKFLQNPVDVRVTLEEATRGHRQIAEIHVHHRLGILQATDETHDMMESIGNAVDKVEKQARRSTAKMIDKRRRADRNGFPHDWPLDVVAKESLGSGDSKPRIVRSSRLQIKPMSLDEAALQLETSRNDFVVFRDAANDRVSVLYKRKDDNYGLIAPDF